MTQMAVFFFAIAGIIGPLDAFLPSKTAIRIQYHILEPSRRATLIEEEKEKEKEAIAVTEEKNKETEFWKIAQN